MKRDQSSAKRRAQIHAQLNKWRAANRERWREINRRSREKHNESANQKVRDWRAANPQKSRSYSHARRAKLYLSSSPGVSADAWRSTCDAFHGECAYCEAAGATVDHVVPISRGGLDAPDNVVPACSRCNSSKGGRLLSEWYVTRGMGLETKADVLAAQRHT